MADTLISELTAEWDFDGGFFGLLRRGTFDAERAKRLAHVLDRIQPPVQPYIDARLVSLLWYMPIFMSWQREQLSEGDNDLVAFDNFSNVVQNACERILGVP